MVLEGRGHIVREVTRMKLVTTILVAAFVVAASISFAFADCPGHTKAQMVKTDDPQISSDRGHHRRCSCRAQ